MRILVCDDEKELAEKTGALVKEYFESIGKDVELEISFSSEEALSRPCYYDFAFLDVEIDNRDGIEIGEKLREVNPRVVIFIITSYDKYLDNAMDLNVFRFITKPVEAERLFKSIEKALERIDNRTITFFLKSSEGTMKVLSDEIVCIQTEGHGSTVTTSGGVFDSADKMKTWRGRLPEKIFFSPHNSYLINLNFVTSYNDSRIKMAGGFFVPVSKRRVAEFKRSLLAFLSDR